METPKNTTDTTKLFTKASHADLYHRYRPTYPPSVLETILTYLKDGSQSTTLKLAVDIGCGTGQATFPLADHFTKVIGCDVSENQIKEAQRHNRLDNVEYCVAPAESMPFLDDGSVDLVTCAAAFHWVDQEKVFPEMKRILRHGGVLAVYCYGLPVLPTAESRQLYAEFLESIREFTSPRFYVAVNKYREINLALDDVTRNDELTIEQDIPLSHFIGQVSSFSPYQTFLQTHPDSDILEVFSNRLKTLIAPTAGPEEDPLMHVQYDIFILLGRNK